MIIPTPGYSGFDGNIFSKIVSSLDPFKKGSLTYSTAEKILGTSVVETTAEIGKGVQTQIDQARATAARATASPYGQTQPGLLGMSTGTLLAMAAAAVAIVFLMQRRR